MNSDRIVKVLSDIKIVFGPATVQGTLNKHPKLKNYLRKSFEYDILELEREIEILENSKNE